MSDSTPELLLPDKPLEDRNRDRLNYAPFAHRLAHTISRRIPIDGLVIAIHGAWGMGKSTMLNYVEQSLTELPQAERPLIARFNPWWFTGREDLTLQFFDCLLRGLDDGKLETEKLRKSLADFAGLVSKLPVPYLKEGAQIAERLLEPDRKDVQKLKADIVSKLSNQDRQMVLIIDDIDRLDREEIRLLFSLIKGVADFPNVCYLLAFDRQVVAQALTGVQGSNGEDYLAKIVQVPVALPQPPRTALDRLLENKLHPLFKATPKEFFDKERFQFFYSEGIRYFINTPRDILRLVNSVALFYRDVQWEVKCPDYVALKALNVFCPSTYEVVEKNKDMFAFLEEDRLEPGGRMERLKRFHKGWLKRVPEKDRARVQRLVSVMFPKLAPVLEAIDIE